MVGMGNRPPAEAISRIMPAHAHTRITPMEQRPWLPGVCSVGTLSSVLLAHTQEAHSAGEPSAMVLLGVASSPLDMHAAGRGLQTSKVSSAP